MNLYIEGLDLAGKSTVCRELAKRLPDYTLFKNRLSKESALHEVAESHRFAGDLSDEVLGWLYYDVVLEDIRTWSGGRKCSIQDSTILVRSIAYHRVHGRENLAGAFEALIPDHPHFDQAFFLTASLEVRLKRLEGRISRGNQAPEDFLILNNRKRFLENESIIKGLMVTHFNARIMDSSGLEDPDQRDSLIDSLLS